MNLRNRIIQPITRAYPFLSGCTFPNRGFFKSITGEPAGAIWTRVVGGEIKVDLDDFVGRCAYFVGDLDRKISTIFDRVIRPGDTVVDIGANIGLTTLRMAHLAGPGGQVHSFEPNPELAKRLNEVIERNKLSNITVHDVALGDTERRLTLNIPVGNMGSASIVPEKIVPSAMTCEVSVRRLDSLFPDTHAVRLVKIDVEGAEAGVLKGALGFIERCRPDIIIFELNDIGSEEDVEAIFGIFKQSDYEIFGIAKTLVTLRLRKVEDIRSDHEDAHDFVAIAKGDRFQAICKTLNAQ